MSKTPKPAVASAFTKADPAAVRTWAKENGVEVGARGRFSREVLAAFHKANPKAKAAWDKPVVIRSWAASQGIETGKRGVFAKSLLDAFYAAHTPSGQPKGYRAKKATVVESTPEVTETVAA